MLHALGKAVSLQLAPLSLPMGSPCLCAKKLCSSALDHLGFFFYLQFSQDAYSFLSGLASISTFILSTSLYIHSLKAIFAFAFMIITMPLLCLWDFDGQEELSLAFGSPVLTFRQRLHPPCTQRDATPRVDCYFLTSYLWQQRIFLFPFMP